MKDIKWKSLGAFSFANSRIFMDRFILKVNESIESHDDSKKAKLSIGFETLDHEKSHVLKFKSSRRKISKNLNETGFL